MVTGRLTAVGVGGVGWDTWSRRWVWVGWGGTRGHGGAGRRFYGVRAEDVDRLAGAHPLMEAWTAGLAALGPAAAPAPAAAAAGAGAEDVTGHPLFAKFLQVRARGCVRACVHGRAWARMRLLVCVGVRALRA